MKLNSVEGYITPFRRSKIHYVVCMRCNNRREMPESGLDGRMAGGIAKTLSRGYISGQDTDLLLMDASGERNTSYREDNLGPNDPANLTSPSIIRLSPPEGMTSRCSLTSRPSQFRPISLLLGGNGNH